MNITFVPANGNNFALDRQGTTIDAIVCHWIVGHQAAADATFQDPNRIASATYSVEDDSVHMHVREKDTAFANGNWGWNLRAISIEHAGGPDIPITDATYETSATLIADIARRYGIPLDRDHVKRHQEVSDSPTSCPGALDVDRLVARAKQLQTSGGTDEVTNLEHAKEEVRLLADVVGNEPNYEEKLPDAFNAHVERIVDGKPLEDRRLGHDFMRDYGWVSAEAAKSLRDSIAGLETAAKTQQDQITALNEKLSSVPSQGQLDALQKANKQLQNQAKIDTVTISDLKAQLATKPNTDNRSAFELIRAGVNLWLKGE